jgi:hypothetical protein
MYGILRSSTNTGVDSELLAVFAAPLTVISNQPAFVSDAVSLGRVVTSQGVQRWEVEANLSPTSDPAAIMAHNVSNGYASKFYIRMPQPYRGAASKSPVGVTIQTSGGLSAGATNMNLIIGGGGGEIAIGEFFQFTGHNKVHVVTNTGTAGTAVGFYPPCRASVTTGTSVIFGDRVTMHARYDTNTSLGIKYVDGVQTDPGSFRFIEEL